MTELHIEARFPKIYKEFDNPYRYKVAYGGRAAARSWTSRSTFMDILP